MKKKWIVFALVLMIVLALFMTACEDKNQPEESTDPQQEQTVDPGTNPSVDPGTNPNVDPGTNPGTDPTIKPDDGKDDEKDKPEPVFVEPDMTRAEKINAYKDQLGPIFAGQNPIANNIISFFDGSDDVTKFNSDDKKTAVIVEQAANYLVDAGISPARFAWLINDLKPIYDLFNAQQAEETAPANGSEGHEALTDSKEKEDKEEEKTAVLAFLSSAKAPIDLLLEEGNLDIVCNSIEKFLKDFPNGGLAKLLGVNTNGIFLNSGSTYGDLTEEEFYDLFGSNKDIVKAFSSVDNNLTHIIATSDSAAHITGTLNDTLRSIVREHREEIKNILTSASSGVEYFSNLKVAVKKPYYAEISAMRRPIPEKMFLYTALAVVKEALPDLTDASIANNIGVLVEAFADDLMASGFDEDLQQIITYIWNSDHYKDNEKPVDISGISAAIKVVGAILTNIDATTAKNILTDVLIVYENYDSAPASVRYAAAESEDGPTEEELAMEAASRILIRLCRLVRPAYLELDTATRARFSEIVKPYLVLKKGDVVIFEKSLKKMLDDLGQKPLYEDLTKEEIEALTGSEEEIEDAYVFQSDAASYISALLSNTINSYPSSPSRPDRVEGIQITQGYLPFVKINTSDRADFVAALKEAKILLRVYNSNGVCVASISDVDTWNDVFAEGDIHWSYEIDTTKAGFTTMTLTYKVNLVDSYSIDLDFFVVAENGANVIIDYYSDTAGMLGAFYKGENFEGYGPYSFSINPDCAFHIYEKDTLTYLCNFERLYGYNGNLTTQKIIDDHAIDTSSCGLKGGLLTYNHPAFGKLYYRFSYYVYEQNNDVMTDFSVCVPKTIDVEDTSFEITVTTYYDCYYDYDTEFTIRKGVGENEDPIVVEVDNPYDNPDFRLDKFSIEGFAFTGELGEQEIKVTYLGKEFTFTVRIVNEDEEEQGFKWPFFRD